jgi:hypothetical protein
VCTIQEICANIYDAVYRWHKEKIEAERQKSFPDEGSTAHWEKEIMVFEKQIEKTEKKLKG